MPEVRSADGTRIAWSETGSGAAVMLAPYFSMLPRIYDPLEAALAGDHRVIRYDMRGTGASERRGPYDLEAGADDLSAVCEAAGGIDAAVCLVDGSAVACGVAARAPELLKSVVAVGSGPFRFGSISSADALIGSPAVVHAFQQQLERDYRGALRAALSRADASLTEDEIRDRVADQIEYASAEAAAGRARAWAADADSEAHARSIGSRLHVILTEGMGSSDSWFPQARDLEPLVREIFPEAVIHWTRDGIVSAAPECADVVRSVVAAEVEGGNIIGTHER